MFDLDAGPATITLPDAGKRFMSMMVIDEDHYVYRRASTARAVTPRPEEGRHALRLVRQFAPSSIRTIPKDVEQVHACRMRSRLSKASPGRFEVPNWDHASQKKVRDALVVLARRSPTCDVQFGRRDQVDPVRHLIGTATAWGGNPDKDAIYLNVTPSKNDGKTIYKLTVKDVPVDGFWSISVYNAEGYFEPNNQRLLAQQHHGNERTPTARLPSSSAAATARFRTACRSRQAGTTWCGSIARAPRF